MEKQAAVAVGVGIVGAHEFQAVLEQSPDHVRALPVIQVFAPAKVVEVGVFFQQVNVFVVLIFQDVLYDGGKFLEEDLRDPFTELRELVHPVEPALASVPQPEGLGGCPVVLSAVHISQTQVKIPDGAAVEERVPCLFVEKEAVVLVIRLDSEVLYQVHAGPGIHVKIVPD